MITLRIKDCKILNKVLECLERYDYHWSTSGRRATETRIYKATLPKVDVLLTLSVIDKQITKGVLSYYLIEVIE